MTEEHAQPSRVRWLAHLLGSTDFARAYTLAAFTTVFAAFAIERMAGNATYVTIVTLLSVIGIGMLVVRRAETSLLRLVPTTLIVFLGWALASVFWSSNKTYTLVGWISAAGLAVIAIVIAHVRDTLQSVRALGDVMRWLLGLSLGLEILSGILLDLPFTFLGIQGNIVALGPVQGIFGTRNMLGFVSVIALITFIIEYRSQSVRTGLAIFSVVLGGVLAALSDSPTVFVLALAVGAASGALVLVRRARAEQRGTLQWMLAAIVTVGLVVAYVLRHIIIAWLGAGSDFSTRATLWSTILTFVRDDPVLGSGWFGAWARFQLPFFNINVALDSTHASALNAYFDVLLQLGWVGLLLFLAFCGIALVRSWLVASMRRSIVYAWTPLVLVTLLVDSLFESFTLTGIGWLMLVVCAVRAGQSRSWRDRIDTLSLGPDLPPVQGTPKAAG